MSFMFILNQYVLNYTRRGFIYDLNTRCMWPMLVFLLHYRIPTILHLAYIHSPRTIIEFYDTLYFCVENVCKSFYAGLLTRSITQFSLQRAFVRKWQRHNGGCMKQILWACLKIKIDCFP